MFLDQIEYALELALVEHMVSTRDVQQQHGGSRTQCCLTAFGVVFASLWRRDGVDHLIDKAPDHLLPGAPVIA
jgi:hypothetical protein